MARNDTTGYPGKTWTQATNADATHITIQNHGPGPVYVAGTASASAPTAVTRASDITTATVKLGPGEGLQNVELATLVLGIAAVRAYVWPAVPVRLMVSHA